MAKNSGRARTRLQQAALELFRERGYDQTTAAEVAERAGVTERTFFRYFPDKREVLFDGEAELWETLADAVAGAPAELGPFDALFRAFRSIQPTIEGYRSFSKPRHELISETPALLERELSKRAAMADTAADALRARGVSDVQATLAAQAGVAAFLHAVVSWFHDPERGLGNHLDSVERDLRSVLGSPMRDGD